MIGRLGFAFCFLIMTSIASAGQPYLDSNEKRSPQFQKLLDNMNRKVADQTRMVDEYIARTRNHKFDKLSQFQKQMYLQELIYTVHTEYSNRPEYSTGNIISKLNYIKGFAASTNYNTAIKYKESQGLWFDQAIAFLIKNNEPRLLFEFSKTLKGALLSIDVQKKEAEEFAEENLIITKQLNNIIHLRRLISHLYISDNFDNKKIRSLINDIDEAERMLSKAYYNDNHIPKTQYNKQMEQFGWVTDKSGNIDREFYTLFDIYLSNGYSSKRIYFENPKVSQQIDKLAASMFKASLLVINSKESNDLSLLENDSVIIDYIIYQEQPVKSLKDMALSNRQQDELKSIVQSVTKNITGDLKNIENNIDPASLSFKMQEAMQKSDLYQNKLSSIRNGFQKSNPKGQQKLAAIVFNNTHGAKIFELGSMSAILPLITKYRRLFNINYLSNQNRSELLFKASNNLYMKLLQPLSHELKNKSTAYIILDGILNLIPMAALQNSEGMHVIESINVQTASSVDDLFRSNSAKKASNAVIFANPSYGGDKVTSKVTSRSPSNISFSSLPNTATEAAMLKEKFDQSGITSKIFLNNDATESLINNIDAVDILHIATHGFFIDTESENDNLYKFMSMSGLAFSGANHGLKGNTYSDGTDGILSALEVLSLNLASTDLVVLSACSTGIGEIDTGEGIHSLSRAFYLAGANSVISSLWKISDNETPEFMDKFYSYYLDGVSVQKALRNTQLDFIKDVNNKRSDPYYWAAFTTLGGYDLDSHPIN